MVVKRKMARTGRRALGSARRSQANSSPARCVRALRLNSMPRLHSLRREACSTPRADAFRRHGFGAALRRLSSQSISTTIPRRARTLLRGVGTPLAILKRASSPLDRELAQRTVFQQTLSDGRESPTHSPTPD